jgi:hypothetical protein
MSHGDFIRWNILPGPFAFDWEWAAPRLPWHDAFHYLWMPLLGSNRCPGIQNLWTLWNGKNGRLLHGYNSSPPDSMLYCLAYLTIQFAFYAKSSAIEHPAIQQNPFLKRIAAVLASTLERF